jgi:DNA (cytosine-5)-methyltransferase 1
MEQLTEAGVFAGIGGFSLGASKAGYKTIWLCEYERQKREILRKNFNESIIFNDVRNLQYPPPVDLLTMGFPCQDISIAGKSTGIIGRRSSLWADGYRIISQTKPRAVIIENSTQLLKQGFEFLLYDLSKIGYDAQWTCISAQQFGYRHKRNRLFIIAYPMQVGCNKLYDIFTLPQKEYSKERLSTWFTKKANLLCDIKRFDRETDWETVPISNGVSRGLDRLAISSSGDAVVVDIAHYLAECVKLFLKNQQCQHNLQKDNQQF